MRLPSRLRRLHGMASTVFSSRVLAACGCLISLLTPLYPPVSEQQSQPAAAHRRQITVLDDSAIKRLVGKSHGRERPLLLYLWYTACQSCCAKLKDVDRIYDEYHDRLDVALVSIGPMDNRDSLSSYIEGHDVRAPAYLVDELDDELVEDVFLKDWEPVVPSAFFYSSTGQIIAADTEAATIEYSTLKRHTERLLSLPPK